MVKQLLWIFLAAIISFLLGWLCFSWSGSKISINIDEVNHFVKGWKIVLPLFLVSLFLIFLIKEFRIDFQEFLPNIILISAGLLSILTLSELKGTLISASASEGKWTAYPPGSAMGESVLDQGLIDPNLEIWLLILTILEVFIPFFLLIVGYKWGEGQVKSPN